MSPCFSTRAQADSDAELARPLAHVVRHEAIDPRRRGEETQSAEEKNQLGAIDFDHKAQREYWCERLPKLHGQNDATVEQKERSYQVMTVWDDYMAQSAAAFQQDRQLRRLVVLAGSGHVERGFGIPERAVQRTGGKAICFAGGVALNWVVNGRLAAEGPFENVYVNPLAGDFTGQPPLLIQAGTGDFALPQARALADRAASHGVDVRLELYPADTHVFHVFWSFLPEAADALQHAGEFIREVLAGQRTQSRAEP